VVEIRLNGKRRDVEPGESVAALIRRLDLDPRWVIAELNGRPVSRDRFEAETLAAGDRLELVRAVAGG
jgi:thiamine biosynthesis protein ThiS